jgi:beta-phosphoglucomutase-like phosphatase (HAD superfamily)
MSYSAANLTSTPDPVVWVRPQSRRPISHVVFDFDGTLSWLRHGWPEIMLRLFREHLPLLPGDEPQHVDQWLEGEILRLNGKPTIFQMHRFAALMAERNAAAPEPEALRAEFQRRLDEAIEARSQQIRSSRAAQDDYLLYGARPLLAHLERRGLTPIILSSTVIERVREEAGLLGIAHYFGSHIYGGVGDPLKFSKRVVLERLLGEEGIAPRQLLAFGDGPVEIADAHALGAIAVGVCSDENRNGSGICHPHKRRQLIEAGADCVVPDFRDCIALVDSLLEGEARA